MNKTVVGQLRHIRQIVERAAVVQYVKIYDSVVRILFKKMPYHVTAYEASSATEKYDAGSIRIGSATNGRI